MITEELVEASRVAFDEVLRKRGLLWLRPDDPAADEIVEEAVREVLRRVKVDYTLVCELREERPGSRRYLFTLGMKDERISLTSKEGEEVEPC